MRDLLLGHDQEEGGSTMTLSEMERLDSDTVSVYDAAKLIGCDPQRLRDALDLDVERPVDMRRFQFPHCKVGSRHYIPRLGFIRWVRGERAPAARAVGE